MKHLPAHERLETEGGRTRDRRWPAIAWGILTTLALGAVGGRLAAQGSGTALGNDGITFPDGTLQTTAAVSAPRLRYYLDVGPPSYDGAAVLTACNDPGFHVASVFEIVDPSNLQYDTTRGATAADSGSGPPQTSQGWIRTGDMGSSQDAVGFANCGTDDSTPWSSNLSGDRGTYLWLEDPLGADWNSPASRIAPWSAGTAPCNATLGVWCVEDSPGSADE